MRTGSLGRSSGHGDAGFFAHGEARRLLQSLRHRVLVLAALLLACTGAMSVAGAAPLRIVVLGDSLVAGYNLRQGTAFPEVLQQRLRASGRDVAITNAGVSGDTAADGLARMDWSIPDGTDLVIVELGANDMLRGYDPDKTRTTLDSIFAGVGKRGMALVIAGMRSIDNWGPAYREKFDAIYPALAQKHNAPLFPFFMDGVFGDTTLLLPDHLHPNNAGVNRMVETFLPFITPIVDRTLGAKGKAG